jgi:SOS-response transcriptional repressor LexA
MHDIGLEIRKRREHLGWTVTKLATLAGISGSFLSRLERGDSYYSHATLLKITGALGVSLDAFYASLSASNVEPAPKDWREIPILDYRQAAQWGVNSSPVSLAGHETIMTNLEHPPSTFALRIRDNSMEPKFFEGDVVVIDPTISPRLGDYVVANDLATGEATFKQYRSGGLNERGDSVFELWPLNPIYAPMRSDRQQLAIVGTQVEHRSYRKP